MEGDTKEKMCHVPPSPLTQRLGSALTLVPRSGSEHQTVAPQHIPYASPTPLIIVLGIQTQIDLSYESCNELLIRLYLKERAGKSLDWGHCLR